ncbi:hypothetical protein [Planococcus halotolerans]|uniref:hypothetical protein n=1 Tax=Planococcus halotolerans TaxID=2233542 RepID=UPI0010582B46|nr:hypothetical protein [Planococcus halotolerans]QHJ69598.1 hypothetical protein DNR44_002675 [Planococcus halotolerans]
MSTTQEFRGLFSSEILSLGWTSLYEIMGDANAYSQVNKHFNYLDQSRLRAIVEQVKLVRVCVGEADILKAGNRLF